MGEQPIVCPDGSIISLGNDRPEPPENGGEPPPENGPPDSGMSHIFCAASLCF